MFVLACKCVAQLFSASVKGLFISLSSCSCGKQKVSVTDLCILSAPHLSDPVSMHRRAVQAGLHVGHTKACTMQLVRLHTNDSHQTCCTICRLLQGVSKQAADRHLRSSVHIEHSDPGTATGLAADNQAACSLLDAQAAKEATALQQSQSQSQSESLQTNADSSRLALKSWPSSIPGALPSETLKKQSSMQYAYHGHHKHWAVERSGSEVPVLEDEEETAGQQDVPVQLPAALSLSAQQTAAGGQVSAQSLGNSQQNRALAGVTHQAQLSLEAGDGQLQLKLLTAPAAVVAAPPMQEQQQHEPAELAAASSAQPAQVSNYSPKQFTTTSEALDKKSRSLMSWHRGKVTPGDNVTLLPSRSIGAASPRMSIKKRGIAASSHSQHSISINGFSIALLDRPEADVIASSSYRQARRLKPSVETMLLHSTEQVNACIQQLQRQRMQQQQMQKILQAMTDASSAMLDHAISASLFEQQDEQM